MDNKFIECLPDEGTRVVVNIVSHPNRDNKDAKRIDFSYEYETIDDNWKSEWKENILNKKDAEMMIKALRNSASQIELLSKKIWG